jgi:oligopeptide transport system substrate-binding protein
MLISTVFIPSTMNKALKMTALLVGVMCLLIGCNRNDSTPVQKGIETQTLHMGNLTEPAGIDPHTTTGKPEVHIQMALYEGLVSKDPKTLAPVPGVAESWTVSDDGLQYTFKLHRNAKWSNGDDLVAEDFVWAWRRALLPALGNQYAYSLFVIKNAEAFHLGKVSDFSEVGVKSLDAKTLQVTLHSPIPYFLDLLDHHSMYPVYRPAIEQAGAIDDRASPWAVLGKVVGNGPFTLTDWQPNKVLSVTKNQNYWDKDKVKLNAIHFYPIDNLQTEERMFRAGQLHKTDSLPIEKISSYVDLKAPELRIHPFLGTYYYQLNVNVKPLDDVRVRQALSMALDRQLIVDKVSKGGQLAAYSFTPPNLQGYTAEAKVTFDVAEAKKLLAEAGFPNGEGFPKLEILYNTLDDHQKIAVAIQQMWKQALNIDVILQNQEWKVYLDNTKNGNYQIARAAWIGDYLDPNTFLDMWLTDGGNNKTGWSNPDYDALIAKAGTAKEQQERYGYFQEAEKILMAEMPIIPIYTYTYRYLLHLSVKGVYDNILEYHPYKYVYLESTDQ